MLDAQCLVLDLIRALRPLCVRLHAQSPDLADQLRRAASSVALNLAEGVRRTGRDKKRAYRIAAAKAQETKTALEVALAWGWLDESDLTTVRQMRAFATLPNDLAFGSDIEPSSPPVVPRRHPSPPLPSSRARRGPGSYHPPP